MNKNPLTPDELKKIVQTTQAIEGYKPASAEIVQKVQQLRRQHNIQVLSSHIEDDVEWGLHGDD
jgi:hypothetical protein